MSQISSVGGDATVNELQLAVYIPPSPPTPVVGLLKGHVVCATGTTGTIPEVSGYADGSKTVLGVLVDNYLPDSNGFVQIAGETDLILAVTCLSPLTPANIGDPLFNVAAGRVDLTRAADTDPLVGSITFVDGSGNYKMVIQDDKPDPGAAGYTSWDLQDDALNTQSVTNGYVVKVESDNGIDTDASIVNILKINLPSTSTDEVGFHYDATAGAWKATENLVQNTEIIFDTDGSLPSGFAGDSGIQLTSNGGFAYTDLRLISNGVSGRANIWLAGTGANGGNIYWAESSVAGSFPLPTVRNSIQATTLVNTNQSMVLYTGKGPGQPVDSATTLCLSEGNSVQIGGSVTGSPLRTGKNLNTTSVYGGAENNTMSGLLAFSDGLLAGISSNGYVSGNRTAVGSTDGTVATAAEWYLGAGSTTGVNIDYYCQYRVYRLTCSYQNSTDGVYQTETITIVSDLATPTWSLSDFLSTGGAASEIAWDVDYVNPGGTSSINYMRVRCYSTQVGKNVQFDLSGQGIGGRLI